MSTVGIPDQRAQPKRVLLSVALSLMMLDCFFAFGAQAVLAQEPRWSEPRPISEGNAAGWAQALSVDLQGRVHAVWIRDANGDEYEDSILYSVRDGAEWSEPVDIWYALRGGPFIPSIAVDSEDRIHLVFDWRGVEGIYYMTAKANEAGSALGWSNPVSVNAGAHSYFSDIAVDPVGSVHVVWEDRTASGEYGEIMYANLSAENGLWSKPLNLSNSPSVWSSHPQIMSDDRGGLHVVWSEGNYWESTEPLFGAYTSSSDGGDSWEDWLRLSDHGTERGPTLAITSGSRVHAIWFDPLQGQLLQAERLELGWAQPVEMASFVQGANVWPRAAADGSQTIHVVVRATSGTELKDVFHTYSADEGKSWSSVARVVGGAASGTGSGGGGWRVDLAVCRGRQLVAVWGESGQIYYSIVEVNAQPWTPMPPAVSWQPEIRPKATVVPSPSSTATAAPSPTALSGVPVPSKPDDFGGQGDLALLLGVIVTSGLMSIIVLAGLLRKSSRP